MYTALRTIVSPTGEKTTRIDRFSGRAITEEWCRVTWEQLGIVSSMEEAIKRFGGHPVLETIRA